MTVFQGFPPLAEVRNRALDIRRYVIRQAAGNGHGYAGQGLQSADILAMLLFSEMNWRWTIPGDIARDRFILSVGHYAIVYYAGLAAAGLLDPDCLDTYGADGSALTLGCEEGISPGTEFSGGSLGQGLGFAAGLAWALRHKNSPARIFNYMSDGELQEGSVWEAAMLASDRALGNLVNIIDVNRTQADGALVLEVEPVGDKFRSFGWAVAEVNGNDLEALQVAFTDLRNMDDRPKALICHTRIGYPSRTIMEKPFAHFVRVDDAEWSQILEEVETAHG